MRYNSLSYLLFFLPILVLLYFFLNRMRLTLAARVCLILGSLFFYSFRDPLYLFVLVGSTCLNYFIGKGIIAKNAAGERSRNLLVTGIALDVTVLGFFKYSAFVTENINNFFGSRFGIPEILLPLALSFYTFQQIAFLVDCHRGQVKLKGFLDYCQFVCFFPQLVLGPIVRYNHIIPQHNSLKGKFLNHENISRGILLIAMGLFKKAFLADSLGKWANYGFNYLESFNAITAWATSLSYTFQVYFDFSGCIDIVMGSALLFNIKLPVNFNSPYKALNVQDFWRRWHITLSDWLRDYIFLPVAYFTMNRIHTRKFLKIKVEIWGYSIAVMITMLIGGIWHGAGWNFLLWGGLHGLALVVLRVWKKARIKLPKAFAWFLTFNFVNFTWIFFRADTFEHAMKVIRGMFSFADFSTTDLLEFLSDGYGFLSIYGFDLDVPFAAAGNNLRAVFLILISFFIVLLFKNSNHLFSLRISPVKSSLWAGIFLFLSLMASFGTVSTDFIYFRF